MKSIIRLYCIVVTIVHRELIRILNRSLQILMFLRYYMHGYSLAWLYFQSHNSVLPVSYEFSATISTIVYFLIYHSLIIQLTVFFIIQSYAQILTVVYLTLSRRVKQYRLNTLSISLCMCYSENISSRYSSNSEANASDLLENG